jgi:hypothetical protein
LTKQKNLSPCRIARQAFPDRSTDSRRGGCARFETCVIVAFRPRRYLRGVYRANEGAMKKAERWFYPGERVRVYYKSVGEWKEATVRSMILLPKQRSPNPSYYQVTCEGKENPRYYRPQELQPVKRTAPVGKSRVRAKRAAPRASATAR